MQTIGFAIWTLAPLVHKVMAEFGSQHLCEKQLMKKCRTAQNRESGKFAGSSHAPPVIVDDDAFPLGENLMKRFGGDTLRPRQRIFNYR